MKRISTVQEAMAQRGLRVYGWVYDIGNGRISPLETGEDPEFAQYELHVPNGDVQ